MARIEQDEIIPSEPTYDKPDVKVCTDAAKIRASLPEGWLDPHLDKAAIGFRMARREWDGAFHMALAFSDSDTGRLIIYDSLLSDDDNDPISYTVKLRDISEAVFRELMPKMGWTW